MSAGTDKCTRKKKDLLQMQRIKNSMHDSELVAPSFKIYHFLLSRFSNLQWKVPFWLWALCSSWAIIGSVYNVQLSSEVHYY